MLVAFPQCTTCTNGLLLFMVREGDQTVFLECEECMTTYLDVSAEVLSTEPGWAPGMVPNTRFATEAEVRARGWAQLIDQELPDGYSGDAPALSLSCSVRGECQSPRLR